MGKIFCLPLEDGRRYCPFLDKPAPNSEVFEWAGGSNPDQ
jgi:hypothetical protein